MVTPLIKDTDLLIEASNGDEDSFSVIVERYSDKLFNFVLRFVGDQQTAEDIVQETFPKVFTSSDRARTLNNFSTWIFTIAANLAKSQLRYRKRWRFISIDSSTHEDTDVIVEAIDESHRPDHTTESKIMHSMIRTAIDSLPPRYREAIIMRDIEGRSCDEIARITDSPVGTIKSRVNRSRLKIQQELEELGDEIPCILNEPRIVIYSTN